MNLSTQKLFSLKLNRNDKLKTMNTPKLSSFSNKRNESSKKSNSIFKKKLNTLSEHHNPFREPKIRCSIFKKKNSNNLCIPQTKKIDLEFSKTTKFCEDSFNNIFLTNQSNSNKVKKNISKINKDKNRNKGNIDTPHDLLRKNNFKSTFIIDNKGNNNLNFQHKKMISSYFNKTIKNSVNKIKKKIIQNTKNNENKNVFKKKSSLNNGIIRKTITFKKINNDRKELTNKNKSINIMKEKNKVEDYKNEKDNSIFENCTNNSFDLSFLGSSINDYFYQSLIDKDN